MKFRHNYLLFILLIAFLSIIWWWLRSIRMGDLPWIDAVTRTITEDVKHTVVYEGFRWVTLFGSKPFMLPFVILMMVVIWGIYRKLLPTLTFGLVILGTYLANKVFKILVSRERPEMSVLLDANGYSFPSGHAMVSLVCYGLLAYFIGGVIRSRLLARSVDCFLLIFVFLIGISRFIVNVHYSTDILTGWGIGSIILYGTILLYNRK